MHCKSHKALFYLPLQCSSQSKATFTKPLAILAAAVADSAAMPPNAATAVRVVGDPVADPTPATLKLYAGDWARFVTWCREQNRPSLPASSATLAAYLLAIAPGLSRGALGRRRAAIRDDGKDWCGILTQGPWTRVLGLADGRRQADRTVAARAAC